jgi:hypothetical protein
VVQIWYPFREPTTRSGEKELVDLSGYDIGQGSTKQSYIIITYVFLSVNCIRFEASDSNVLATGS